MIEKIDYIQQFKNHYAAQDERSRTIQAYFEDNASLASKCMSLGVEVVKHPTIKGQVAIAANDTLSTQLFAGFFEQFEGTALEFVEELADWRAGNAGRGEA